jgi:hypothetical protein
MRLEGSPFEARVGKNIRRPHLNQVSCHIFTCHSKLCWRLKWGESQFQVSPSKKKRKKKTTTKQFARPTSTEKSWV